MHPSPPTPPPLVLVIDDDASVRQLLATALPLHGFAALVATDGPAGVELYCRHGPKVALVLCDVRMPGLDGPGVLAALKAIDPGVRLCFMTGDSGPYDERELLAAGALHVFAKPFNLAELAGRLRTLAALS